MKHIFDCHECVHHSAICEFNRYRKDLEEMYGSKIKVIRMFWWFGWKVLFEFYQDEHCDNLKYFNALEEIREMVNEPCVPTEKDCHTCPTNCFTKDILKKIDEVLK